MTILSPLPVTDDNVFQPEQEWCTQCTHNLDDEPGMGRDVVGSRILPTDHGSQLFLELDCGHRVISDAQPELTGPDNLFSADLASLAG